jgi:energy-coupling factor transporter ATP-binding protein EcfA2
MPRRVAFLDEPTSGLDSCTAAGVMRVVKGLAEGGTTICATIHSPSAATFALFDRVLLLVRGRVAFFGPQGVDAMTFAASMWGVPLPLAPAPGAGGVSAAEWLVEVVTEADLQGSAGALADAYGASQLCTVSADGWACARTAGAFLVFRLHALLAHSLCPCLLGQAVLLAVGWN